MAKYRANPLGHLEAELIEDKSTVTPFSSPSGYDDLIRDQVPVKTGLAAQDTFKADASSPSSRADVELRRMHVLSIPDGGDIGGGKLSGASLLKEFGEGSAYKGAKDFTDDKSA